MIYFIQHGASGPVKIGYSRKPAKRISAIAIACPDPIAILGVVEGSHSLEQRMHKALRAHRHRGEWFRPDEAVLTFIQRRLSSGPEAVHAEIQRLEQSKAESLLSLDRLSDDFPQLMRCGFRLALEETSVSGLAARLGLTDRRVRDVVASGLPTVAEFISISEIAPEITAFASLACGRDNLPQLEAAREALDDLIRRRVKVA